MKMLNFHRHLLQVLVALISLTVFGDAIRLNSNGGYDIVIGVEDNTPEPMDVRNFLDEIRSGVEQFSAQLWKTTHRRFYINSVDVLVPGHWWTVSNFDTATWQTLLGSEIRITHDVESPNVVNPNPCGTSGLYVELPDKFFKVPRGGLYGAIGKAMVNLWARYRFGVWEEHGIPGDTKFPYFYVYPSFEPKWEATGCSNEEINGSFRTFDGEISERCDPYGAESPDDDCRFIPSPSNAANSSLMHLHWLDSVTEFCDSKTHNYVAPNRQNLFCGHRSVWEVIMESDDYKATKVCTESVALPKFRVMKESRSPEFYVLLDRGRTVTPEKVLKEAMAALNIFVSYPTLERINIAVGTYPHTNQGKNHYYVKEEIGWAPISSVFNDIERVLSESSHPDGPVVRDFGLAIQEVVEQIKQRNHQAGTVLLVVKRGAGPNTFDKITFEQEVIASVKEDSRIQVFAIESQQGEQTPYTNLQTLVSATNGQYHMINDTVNTARKLEKVLSGIQEKLEQSSIMNSISSWVTQKQYTKPHESIEIPIYDNANIVKIHLTTHKQMVETDIYLEQLSGEHATMQLIQKGEWDENADLTRRIVFTYVINNPTQGSLWSLKHGCHTEKVNECRFFLVVTAHTDRPTPRVSDIDADMIFNSQSITVDVSTSAGQYNYVDMSDQGLKIVPFAIFAKIEMTQQRVLGLENVTALIRLGGEHNNHLGDWTIRLSDDGRGVPDVSEHDGIYSGVFTPLENGLYRISVTAVGVSNPTGSSFQDIRIVNHAGGLMQINQINYGCKNSSKPRCASAVPRASFSRSQDLQSSIAVENAGTFKPGKPTRILDFAVKTFPNFNLEFEFTSPRLLGSDETPEEFRIYMAPHVDNFIGSTDLTKLLIIQRGEAPGTPVNIHFNAASKAVPYYAVEAIYGGQKGGPSNVVGVVPSEEGEIVPSPITTTTRPSTTTTEFPSSSTTTTTEFSSSSTTSTTEFPWPSTASTTESPFPTTTEESEETDEPIIPTSSSTPSPTSTTTENTELPITTTLSPSTTEGDISSTISPTTTTSPPVTSDITDPIGSSTTAQPSSSTTITSTTEDISSTPSPTTTSPPVTSDITDPIGSSTTSTTTEVPSSTPDEDITPSPTEGSTSTNSPSSTTSDVTDPIISSTTTESPTTSLSTTTTEEGVSSTIPPTTTDITDPIISTTSSTTTEPSTSSSLPTTTTEEDISSTTTVAPPITSDITDTSSTSTTTESSTSTNPSSSTSTTEESTSTSTASPTTTEPPVTSPSSTTEKEATTSLPTSTTTEGDISSTVPSTTLPPVTSDNPDPTSTSTEPSSSSTSTSTEPSSSSTSTSTESSSSSTSTSTEPSSSSTSTSTEPSSTSTSTSTEPSSSSTSTSTESSSSSTSTSTEPSSSSTSTSTESSSSSTSTSTEPSSSSTSTSTEPSSSSTSTSTEPPSSSTSTSTEPSSSSTSTSTEPSSTSTTSSTTTSTSTEASSSTPGGEVSTRPTTTTEDISSPASTPSTPVTEHSQSAALTLRSSEALLSVLMLSILALRT